MNRCKTCSQWMFTEDHSCGTRFDVQLDENYIERQDRDVMWREEAETVYGVNVSHALERWAEEEDCDSGEYEIVSGSPARVRIREHGTDEWSVFIVSGESVTSYMSMPEVPR